MQSHLNPGTGLFTCTKYLEGPVAQKRLAGQATSYHVLGYRQLLIAFIPNPLDQSFPDGIGVFIIQFGCP